MHPNSTNGIFEKIEIFGILSSFVQNSSPNILVTSFRTKTPKVWKVFKIFQTFRNFSKKGLLAPRTHPNPQMKFLKKVEIFENFKNFICRFGCVLGAKSPFFENFRKLWKILKTFHTLTVFRRSKLAELLLLEIKCLKPKFWIFVIFTIYMLYICHFGVKWDPTLGRNIFISTRS